MKPKRKVTRKPARRPKNQEARKAMTASEYPDEMPPREAARYLHTTERTLYEWTKEGRVAHLRLAPKKIVYLKADLDAFKAKCRVPERKPDGSTSTQSSAVPPLETPAILADMSAQDALDTVASAG